MSEASVLIVDDETAIRDMVATALEVSGFCCLRAENARTAYALIVDERPDLVLLDWMMPGLDGPALFRKMRESPQTKDLPVVFITAKASQRELDELKTMGAIGTISKPFAPKDLPDQLRALWSTLP